MIATAAAAAALLVGYPLSEDPHGPAEPVAKQAFLTPTGLEPKASSPRVGAGSVMALSPDRSQVVALHYQDDALRFYDRGGRPTGRVPIAPQPGATMMSWLTNRRLLVFTCGGYPAGNDHCDATTVRVVDTKAHEIVRTRELPKGIGDVSTVDGRAIAVLPSFVTKRPGTFVLDRNGRITHRYRISGSSSGDLVTNADSGSGPGAGPNGSGGRLMRIDPRTGASQERDFPRVPVLVLPRPRSVDIVQVSQTRFLQIDHESLRTVRSFRTPGDVYPMRDGYLVRNGDLTAFSLGGKRLWSTPLSFAEIAAVGRYVYVQRGLDGPDPDEPNYRVDVYAARTGKQVAEVPGRYVLTTAGWSSSHGTRGPQLSGGNLYYEDD